MRNLIALALAAGVTFAATAPADAAQGCGRGGHRGPYGRCVSNFRDGPGYGRPHSGVTLVIGQRYPGRGYWDGHRYYQNRYAYRGGYRYR